MQIKPLSPELAVAAQIHPEDVSTIANQGYRSLINNRPDGESSDQTPGHAIEEAGQALGMGYYYQPVVSGSLTLKDVQDFEELMEKADKPVLAYCRSGTRCTTLWALSQAGKQDTDSILSAAAEAGYDLSGMRDTIEALAEQKSSS